jgi:uncharacterized membrane protein YvlD (DUF360 family)
MARVNFMSQTMTRPLAIRTWFVAVALVIVAAIATGMHVTIGAAATVLALCLVFPIVALFVWPGVEAPTVSNTVHDRDRRR